MYVSGQLGLDVDGTLPADAVSQLGRALDNVALNLAEAGMGVGDVVYLRTFVVGPSDPGRRRSVFKGWLGDHRPCMTLVQVAGLAAPQFLVEVEAMACRDVAAGRQGREGTPGRVPGGPGGPGSSGVG